jgi:hypothetical protein
MRSSPLSLTRATRRALRAAALLTTTALLCSSAHFAQAKPEEESFPVIGSVSSSVAFNHSNFVGEEQGGVAETYGLPEASGFGWASMSLNFGMSYSWAFSKDYSPIFFSGGLSFNRALVESVSRAGTPTTQPGEVTVGDIGFSAGWGLPGVGKLVKGLMTNISVNGSLPTSRMSRSAGLISSTSANLSVIYATPIKLVMQLFGSTGVNLLEDSTIQIDCELMPRYCAVSGADLGAANSLFSWATGFGMQYPLPFINGLRVGAGYSIFGGFGAVSYGDTTADPFASQYAQSGTQWGVPFHRMGFSLTYGFNNTGSAAQQALNESLQGQSKEEETSEFLKRLSVRLGMSTGQRLYSMDNKRVTFPLFDFETDNLSRTSYNLSAQLAF